MQRNSAESAIKKLYPVTNFKITCPVSLASEKHDSLWHWFIERYVFFRDQRFKNDPRANYLLPITLKSFLAITIIGTVAVGFFVATYGAARFGIISLRDLFPGHESLTFSNVMKFTMPTIAGLSVAYWNVSTMYNRKWNYCADLYNKMLATEDATARAQLRNALAIDLLVLDLWAHRSFRELFRDELESSLYATYKDQSIIDGKITDISEGKMCEKIAHELLEHRNAMLSIERQKIVVLKDLYRIYNQSEKESSSTHHGKVRTKNRKAG